MNLTIAELAEIPLPAALLQSSHVVAHTPEWCGAAPGAVVHRVRNSCLVIGTDDSDPRSAPVVDRLLDEMDAVSGGLPHRQALRLTMLATSLRVVAGRPVHAMGSSIDALEHACAGIASRTALQVRVVQAESFALPAPPVAALVMVQLAANAERHDEAEEVELLAARQSFTVRWRAASEDVRARAARPRVDRERWGLGFARIAADSIGAVLYPPAGGRTRSRRASLEVGLNRLSLPLALIRDGKVGKATRVWDEETGLLPGAAIADGSRTARCVTAAQSDPGRAIAVDGWSARTGRQGTWVAIPPNGTVDRARDVLDGVVHERALWDGVPEPARSRIVALAAILASLLGDELVRVPGASWNRRAQAMAGPFGVPIPVPHFAGAGAVDPRVALFLATELGERFDTVDDDLYLTIRADRSDDPLARVLLPAGDRALKLS